MASDYKARITSQHADKPKYMALVDQTTQPLADIQALMSGMPLLFDLDTAVGDQLDTVGLWVGIGRYVKFPITGKYFAFDTSGVGFDEGVWKGRYDPEYTLEALSDDNYRILLRSHIATNSWDGTLETSKDVLATVVTPETNVFIQDNSDMSITIGIAGTPPDPVFQNILLQGLIPIKPAGVNVNYAMPSVDDQPILGLDMDTETIAGLDKGVWANIYEMQG